MSDNLTRQRPSISWHSSSLPNVFRITLWISIAVIFAICFLDLTGWAFNITILMSIMPHWLPMNAITAICLFLAATSLLILQFDFTTTNLKILPKLFGTIICIVSLVTLYALFYSSETGLESALTDVTWLGFFLSPGNRMDVLMSCLFLLLGFILILLSVDRKVTSEIAHAIIVPVTLISYYLPISYILGIYKNTEMEEIPMSLNTGIAFLALCIVILLMRPHTWLLKVFSSGSTGGLIARRLIPAVMIIPVVIGWIRIRGERLGFFESEKGVVLVAVTYTVCFLTLVWLLARSVNLIDQQRRASEETLLETAQRLKYHYENSPLAVVEWRKDFFITQWSLEAERIFGWKKEEAIGKRIDNMNIIYEEDIPIVEKVMERLSDGKEIKIISSNRNYTKKGDIIECIWYNTSMKDESGQLSSVMSLIQDVTILRKTEKELEASKESYRELVTNARSIIVKIDTTGRFTFANEFAQSFFGYTEEELIGKSVMDTIVPQTESTGRNLDEMVEDISEDPDKYSININENIKKNGDRIWIEWHNKAMFDFNGQRTGHIAIGVDITERKKAEEALRMSKENLLSVLNATQESIFMFDREGRFTMANSTGSKRLNIIAEEDIIGHHFSEFMTPETAEIRQAKLNEVFNTGNPLEFEDERYGIFFHHNFFPVTKDGEVSFVVAYSTNITERKRNEDKLKESEDQFRTIAESLPVLISINRISNSIILFVNEPYEKAFGFKKGELTGKKVHDIFCDLSDQTNLSSTLKEKGGTYNTEIKVKKADGTPFWIMTSIRTIMFMNEPSYLTASIDITETKKAQEELLRLNRTLDAHSKSSQLMMHSDNEFAYLNDVCRIIIEDCGYKMVWIGYAQNDENKSVKPVAYSGFNEGYLEQLNVTWSNTKRGRGPTGTAIRTGKPSICSNMHTDPAFKPWRKEALKRGYSSSLVLPLISDKKPFGAITIYSNEPNVFSEKEIILLSDLTKDLAYGVSYLRLAESEKTALRAIKESEAQLKELNATKDKFFNIIAHDLKNPFTSLLGSSELLYENIDHMSSENIKKLTLILNDSAKGGYAILQNLLDWSRSQTGMLKYNPVRINLKDLINENISNLQLPAANKEIHLISETEENIFINGDKNMINTILRNLLSNAIKFTNRYGNVVIEAVIEPENVIVSVKDTGIGISEEKIKTLFRIDTKHSMPGTENEQGTGLGLKLCREFAEKMGGRIWVESTENKGSDFKFSIPAKIDT